MKLTGLLVALPLALVACQGDDVTSPEVGTLDVTTTTSGSEPDPDGYILTVDGSAVNIGPGATVSIPDLTAGEHQLALADVAANCRGDTANPSRAMVAQGQRTSVTFRIECTATVGTLELVVATSGQSRPSEPYHLLLDGLDRGAVAPDADTLIAGVAEGSHRIALGGVPANCAVSDLSLPVEIVAGTTTPVAVQVVCTVTGSVAELVVMTSTTGSSLDPDGYALQIYVKDDSIPIGLNDTVRVTDVAAIDQAVGLDFLSDNCVVEGENPRRLALAVGSTDTLVFAVRCRTPLASPWTLVPTGRTDRLLSVSGTSGSNVFLTGDPGPEPGCQSLCGRMSLWHYDGVSATAQFIHSGGVEGIWASPDGKAFALSEGTFPSPILEFDGSTWTSVPTPAIDFGGSGGAFHSIWGSASDDVFAVGVIADLSGSVDGYIAHFDGTAWTPMAVPEDIDGVSLASVWGAGPNDVYAVGVVHDPGQGYFGGVVLHYDGHQWSRILFDPYQSFRHVWGRSATEVYVTASTSLPGGASGGDKPFGPGLILRYDGAVWTALPRPSSAPLGPVWAGSTSNLYVLQAFGSNKVWHFDGSGWTQLIIGGSPMYDLWGSPTGELFAVGGEGTILRGP